MAAALKNMTNGEYVGESRSARVIIEFAQYEAFFQVYLTIEYIHGVAIGAYTWQYGDSYDQLAKQAFASFFILGPDDSIYAMQEIATGPWYRETVEKYKVSPHTVAVKCKFGKLTVHYNLAFVAACVRCVFI